MTLCGLLNLAGGWLEWPDEARPGGVQWAAAHREASLYVFVYADGSRSIFCNAEGHIAGLGQHIPDRVVADFLTSLVESRGG